MKKLYILAFASVFFAACGNDSSSSASDTEQPAYDYGRGYTYATAYQFDETTRILYQGTDACYYHSDSKTFTWEKDTAALDTNRLTVIGDSMWISPVERVVAEDPDMQDFYDTYDNRETLLLSDDHDGIYGKWTMTGCRRVLGETNIKCTASVGGMKGIARTITITADSIYVTTVVDADDPNPYLSQWNLESIFDNFLGFEISGSVIDSLKEAKVIKIISSTEFSIGSQTFTRGGAVKFDMTGMNYYTSLASNGRACERHEQLAYITEQQCLEGNADILLSDRGDEHESYHYEDGPVEGINYDNREEFYACTRALATEETKNILKAFDRHNTD